MAGTDRLIDWSKSKLGDDDRKTIEDAQRKINEFDTKGSFKRFSEKNDWANARGKDGVSIRQEVERANSSYVDTVRRDVSKEKRVDDLREYQVDNDYMPDTVTAAKEIIEKRIEELAVSDDVFTDRIERVRTISSLERVADEWRNAGGDRDKIARYVNRKSEDLGYGKILMD